MSSLFSGCPQPQYEVLEEELQNVATAVASNGAPSPRSPMYSPRGASPGPSRVGPAGALRVGVWSHTQPSVATFCSVCLNG